MTKAQFSYFLAFIQHVCQELWKSALSKYATKAENAAVSDRITQIEANEGALILAVDFETGCLVQVGSVNGTFGVDYETGYLTFEPAPTQSQEQNESE